jgi:hypothetical protein
MRIIITAKDPLSHIKERKSDNKGIRMARLSESIGDT